MKTVFKYTLQNDLNLVRMPWGAVLLDVQVQNSVPVVWALVETDAPKVLRRLLLTTTGAALLTDVGQYVGTFQAHDGQFVFHLFDQGEVKA